MKRKVSLKDIAKKAGVSIALVSYVLNNQKEGRISKETAQTIKDIAHKMDYRVNQIAQSLKTNKTFTIGLIIGEISNPFFSSLASIIEIEAEKNNYTVIFGSSHENPQKFNTIINALLNRQVDGLIIAPPEGSQPQINILQKQGIPVVLIDRYFPNLKTNYVILDNQEASYKAVKHLLDEGRKSIGLITYKTGLCHILDRKTGYLQALKENNIYIKKKWVKEVDISNNQKEIENAIAELLSGYFPVDALLFASIGIANYGVKYINTLDLKVPESLSIVSFDEPESLDLFYAPITYLSQPLMEMGKISTELLIKNIQQKDRIVPKPIQLKATLIIRNSSVTKKN